MYDILIKNGFVVDGTRKEKYVADVAIKDNIIEKIEKNIKEEAKRLIDAKGKIVSPGFIDIHTHSDFHFLLDNKAESKIYQGVTTEVVGQCGSSRYPCKPEGLANLKNYVGVYTEITFNSFADGVAAAKEKNIYPSINWLPLVGHNALRTSVMGLEGRKATKEEISVMVELLEQEMKAGAWGLSLGLGYPPGIFADLEELVALGHVVAKYNGKIASHMRNQGDTIYDALNEMFEINRQTGAHVHIAHLKVGGERNWGTSDKVLAYIRKAQEEGVHVTCDMYPYEAASSGITNVLPKWALDGGLEGATKRFEGPERDKVMAELNKKFARDVDGERVYIVSTYGKYPIADDKTITELAKELNITMAEAIEKIILATRGRCQQINFAMDPADVRNFIKETDIAIGSDGSGISHDPNKVDGKPHPRAFGTFPRFLKMARDENLMPLEDAVYKMTGLSAEILGLKDRGILAEGKKADVTIFDANKVKDTATYSNPFCKPEGINYVIVNGKVAIDNGDQTEVRGGEFLFKR